MTGTAIVNQSTLKKHFLHNKIMPSWFLTVISVLLALSSASAHPVHGDGKAALPANQMRSQRGTLILTKSTNITRVTIDNPPINLFDNNLAADFLDFLISIQPSLGAINYPKVVIIDSANPDFFIPHIDLSAALTPLTPAAEQLFADVEDISRFLRNTTSSVLIAEVNGRTSGYGDEVLLQTDLRFVGPHARVSQFETAFGTFPGAGGTQALPRLINRGRALQYIFTADAVDNEDGVALGWFNAYYNRTSDLKREVNKIAERIALAPASGLNATKAAIPELYPPQSVYERDTAIFFASFGPETQRLIKKALVLGKNQTRSQWELDIPYSLLELYE